MLNGETPCVGTMNLPPPKAGLCWQDTQIAHGSLNQTLLTRQLCWNIPANKEKSSKFKAYWITSVKLLLPSSCSNEPQRASEPREKKHTLQAAAVDDCPQAFLQGSVVASSQDGRAIVLTGRDSWITSFLQRLCKSMRLRRYGDQ